MVAADARGAGSAVRPGLFRPGIRARLMLAFALIAGFSALAAGAGIHAFRSVGERLGTIEERLPPVIAALELSRSAERIIAAAPALLAAADRARLDEVKAGLAGETERLAAALAKVRALGGGLPVADVAAEAEALTADLAALDRIVVRRDETGRSLAAARDSLFEAVAGIQRLLAPWLEVTEREVGVALADPAGGPLVADRIRRLRAIQAAQRQTGAVTDLLAEVSTASDPDRLPVLSFQIQRGLDALAGAGAEADPRLEAALAERLAGLASLARGPGSLPALRAREIALLAEGESLLAAAAERSRALAAAVDRLGAVAEAEVSAAVGEALEVQHVGTRSLALLAGLSFVSSALIVWLWVGRRIARPLAALADGMLAIAAGREHRPVAADGPGEIAGMARALEVFRRTMVERDALIAEKARAAERLEAEVRLRTEELQEKTRRLEIADREKLHVISAASHDLRQPLHALGLFLSQLRGTRSARDRARLMDRIEAAMGSVSELFAALLDLSRLETGRLEADVGVVPLARPLARVEATFAAAAREKGLSLAIVPTSLAVRSDPVLLERILHNLVSNAIRYTESGGVVVGARRRGDRVRLDVVDSGPGIPVAEHGRIFAEFHRGATGGGGLGLGLAIVDRLCRLLEHGIDLVSEPGRGSRFSVTVPLAPAGARAPDVLDEAAGPARDRLVLVLEDDPMVAESMAGLLGTWGCRVVSVPSGEAALAALADLSRGPDLVIADFHLPGMDGVEAIRRLRAAAGGPLPALLVSGDAAAGAGSGLLVLAKPVAPMRLRAALARATAAEPAGAA